MRTELGDLQVLDSHAHFFSQPFFLQFVRALQGDLPAEDSYAGLSRRLGWELPTSDHAALGKRWVDEMDRHEVDRMVLIASMPGDEESILAAVRAFPQRIVGYFMLDPMRADAPERARRAFADGLRGVCLFPAMHHFHAWEERCYPIYQAAGEAAAVVFVHFGVLKMGIRDALGLPSRFDMRFSNPVDLHRVAKDFPAVTFVMPHFGCGFLREALMVGDQCGNVCVDTSSSNAWTKTMPVPLELREVFHASLRVFGPQRVLFGTDSTCFPRGWRRDVFDAQIEALKTLGISSADAGQIFGGNLRRVLTL